MYRLFFVLLSTAKLNIVEQIWFVSIETTFDRTDSHSANRLHALAKRPVTVLMDHSFSTNYNLYRNFVESCNSTNKANSHTPIKVEIHTRQKLCHFSRQTILSKKFRPGCPGWVFILKNFYRDFDSFVKWRTCSWKHRAWHIFGAARRLWSAVNAPRRFVNVVVYVGGRGGNHGVGQAFFFREKGWAKREFHDGWGWVIGCFVKNDTHFNSCGRFKDVRAQKLPTHRFFKKLWLTVENDKIR